MDTPNDAHDHADADADAHRDPAAVRQSDTRRYLLRCTYAPELDVNGVVRYAYRRRVFHDGSVEFDTISAARYDALTADAPDLDPVRNPGAWADTAT